MHFTEILACLLAFSLLFPMPEALAGNVPEKDNAPPAVSTPLPSSAHTAPELNAIAWRFYKNGKYRQAEIFFQSALRAGAHGETAVSALLGMGYTKLKLGKNQEAAQYFNMAGEQGRSLKGADMDKAQEGIFLAAMSGGDAVKAWGLLKKNSQRAWTDSYRKPEIEIPLCVDAGDSEGALRLVGKYHDDPEIQENEKEREIYLSLLWFLAKEKESSRLLCKEMLKGGLPRAQVTACISRLRNRDRSAYAQLGRDARKTHPEWFKKKKKPVVTDAMRAGQAFEKKDYATALNLSRKALEKQPENIDLVAMAAWSAYHLEQYREAEKWFRKGLEFKKTPAMQSGLCWSLIRQKRCAECADTFEGQDVSASPELLEPVLQAMRCEGMKQYKASHWESAAERFEKFLKLSPEPDQGVREMLAWSYYRAGKWAEADREFSVLLETEQREEWINARGRCLGMQGKESEILALYERYHGDACKAGDLAAFLYSSGVEQERICRTAGCENYLAAGIRYRYRSGEYGQGRLDDWYLPALYARYRLSDNLLFRANGGFRHVSNHRHSDDFKDAYFSFLYEPASMIHLSAGAGFTGSGALIGTRPLWHAGGTVDTPAGIFTLTGYRSTVDDSLLSIAGMRGSYIGKPCPARLACKNRDKCDDCARKYKPCSGCDKFGGVNRTGAYISWSGDIWKLNTNALFDIEQITGTKVRRNHKYLANFSTGHNVPVPYRLRNFIQPLWVGGYATWFRYERNLNYYTCGNGGYFSPRSFIGAGPVINIRTIEGRCWIASLNASVGYVNYIEDDGWYHPMEKGDARGCWYNGRSLNLLGYGVHGRSAWRLNRYVAIEARGGVDRSASFTEWGAALNLIIYPDRVAGLFFQGLPEAVPWLP